MIIIADDQLDTESVELMFNIVKDHHAEDRWQEVSYRDEGHFKRREDEVAKEIWAKMVLKMISVLPRDEQKGLPNFKNHNAIMATPESEILQIMTSLMRNNFRFAFIVDLSADSSSQTPDISYGVKVIRELALLLKPNNETNQHQKTKCAIRELFGDSRYLTIFYSKYEFYSKPDFQPDVINTCWHLSLQKNQCVVNPAEKIDSWVQEPFQHSQECPVIYKTYRSEHAGKILPKVIKWQTASVL